MIKFVEHLKKLNSSPKRENLKRKDNYQKFKL